MRRWKLAATAVVSSGVLAGGMFAAFNLTAQAATNTCTATIGTAAPTCTVTDTAFASWFASGQPQKDGLVQPANSIAQPVEMADQRPGLTGVVPQRMPTFRSADVGRPALGFGPAPG